MECLFETLESVCNMNSPLGLSPEESKTLGLSQSLCRGADGGESIDSGELLILNQKKRWKKRYFVLTWRVDGLYNAQSFRACLLQGFLPLQE